MNLLKGPPNIPQNIDEILFYKLSTKKYFNELKALVWVFIQLMATLLVLGIIWITIEWVKLVVTGIAVSLALILLVVLIYIF